MNLTVVLDWLSTYIVGSTLLLGATWLLTTLVRLPARRAEYVWRVAIVVSLAAAALQLSRDPVRLPSVSRAEWAPVERVAQPMAPRGRLHADATSESPARDARNGEGSPGNPVFRGPVTEARDAVAWPVWVAFVWLAGACVHLAMLWARHRSFMRSLGVRQRVTDAGVCDAFARLAGEFALPATPRLTKSARLSSPAVLGRDEICVPEPFFRMAEDRQAAILAHELAHVERGDPRWRLALETLRCALFFQPLLRAACGRLRAAAEVLADERAVNATRAPGALASALADVASWMPIGRSPAVAALEQDSDLVERVRQILWPSSHASASVTGVLKWGAPIVMLAPLVLVPRFALAPRLQGGPGDAYRLTAVAESSIRLDAGAERDAWDVQVVHTTDGIVVLDQARDRIRWYDASGAPQRTRAADGDDLSFSQASRLVRFPGDTILVEGGVWDRSGPEPVYRRLRALYDADGVLAGTEPAEWAPGLGLGEGCVMHLQADRSFTGCWREAGVASSPAGPGLFRGAVRHVFVPPGGDRAVRLGMYPGIEQYGVVKPDGDVTYAAHPFHSRTHSAAGGTPLRIYVAPNPEYRIEVWTPDGVLERVIGRDVDRRSPTMAERESARAELFAWYQDIETRRAGHSGSPDPTSVASERARWIVDRVPVPDAVPAIHGLTVSETGELWVLREGWLGAHTRSLWDVFDGDGDYLGEVTGPAGFHLRAVGRDYVTGVRAMDGNVEIEVYGLETGGR